MFAMVAALALTTFGRFYLVSWLGERVAADLRRDVFDRVLALSPAYFETARTGDILSRLTADIAVLQALIGSAVSQGIRNALMCVGAFAMLLVTSVEARRHHRGGAAAGGRPADPVRPAREAAVARLAGTGRRSRRLCRGDHQRPALGAGVHP